MYKAFLVKYAEIGLKGKNRHVFENALRDQIRFNLEKIGGNFDVSREQGRIFIECLGDFDYEETVAALKKVFGIWAIMPVVVIENTDWNSVKEEVAKYVDQFYPDKNFTFKVEAKRSTSNMN